MQPLHHAWKQTGVLWPKDCFILQYLTISIKFTKYCTSGETVPVQHTREHPQHSTAHYPVCLNLGEQRAPGELPMPERASGLCHTLPRAAALPKCCLLRPKTYQNVAAGQKSSQPGSKSRESLCISTNTLSEVQQATRAV